MLREAITVIVLRILICNIWASRNYANRLTRIA